MPSDIAPVVFDTVLPTFGGYCDRPEKADLHAWWNNDSITEGICGLIGVFGSGKTMLLSSFLEEIRANNEATLQVPIFVFSFDSSEATFERFLQSLSRFIYTKVLPWWGSPSTAPKGPIESSTIRDALKYDVPADVLIVIDALEKSKDPDAEMANDQDDIFSPGLSQLLQEAVRGGFPSIRWLITSRTVPAAVRFSALVSGGTQQAKIAPAELGIDDEVESTRYTPIHISRLTESTGLSILKQYGIEGNDTSLKEIVTRCDGHAFLLTLAASYLKTFFDGDPNHLPTALESLSDSSHAPKAGGELNAKYNRCLTRQYDRLIASIESQLAKKSQRVYRYLQALCFLRTGARRTFCDALYEDVATLAFNAKERSLLVDDIGHEQALLLLRSLQLAWPEGNQLQIHHAVKHAIFGNYPKDRRRDLHLKLARSFESHLSFQSQQEWSLGDLPALEELAYQYFEAGVWEKAYENAAKLFFHTSTNKTPEYDGRVCEIFFDTVSPVTAKLPRQGQRVDHAALFERWGSSLQHTGRLDEAIASHRRCLNLLKNDKSEIGIHLSDVNFTEMYYTLQVQGRLIPALRVLMQREDAIQRRNKRWNMGSPSPLDQTLERVEGSIAYQLIDLGFLRKARSYHVPLVDPRHLRRLYGSLEPVLSFEGFTDLESVLRGNIETATKLSTQPLEVRHLAELYLQTGRLDDATELIRQAVTEVDILNSPIVLGKILPLQVRTTLARLEKVLVAGAILEADRVASVCLQQISEATELAQIYGMGACHQQVQSSHASFCLLSGHFDDAIDIARGTLFGRESAGSDNVYLGQVRSESDDPKRRGIFPPKDSGRLPLYAALHPDCEDPWIELECREVIAMAKTYAIYFDQSLTCPPAKAMQEADEELRRILRIRIRLQAERPAQAVEDVKIKKLQELSSLLSECVLPEPPQHLINLLKRRSNVGSEETDVRACLRDALERMKSGVQKLVDHFATVRNSNGEKVILAYMQLTYIETRAAILEGVENVTLDMAHSKLLSNDSSIPFIVDEKLADDFGAIRHDIGQLVSYIDRIPQDDSTALKFQTWRKRVQNARCILGELAKRGTRRFLSPTRSMQTASEAAAESTNRD